MKKTKSIILLVSILIITFIIGWYSKAQHDETIQKHYNGRELSIGVIGNTPEIWEKQIKFTEMQVSDLEKADLISKFDAIFIVKDSMIEGIEAQYTNYMTKYKIPFFFCSIKEGDNSQTYIGLITTDSMNRTVTYNLQPNKNNKTNIKNMYSQIFKTIADNNFFPGA